MLTPVLRMGKNKKNQSVVEGGDPKTQAAKPRPEEKVTEPVRLRKTFKQKLQLVAEDAGIEMGVLVEQQLGDYISREYLRVLQKKLKEAEGT